MKLRNILFGIGVIGASLLPFTGAKAQNLESTLNNQNQIEQISQSKKLNMSFDNNYASRYVFFGIPFSEGPVWQPTLSAQYGTFDEEGRLVKGLSGFTMANKDFATQKWNKVDFGIDYTYPVGENSIFSLGTIYFPSELDGKWESIGTAYANFSKGDLFLTLHKLYGAFDGNYFELGFGKEYPINDRFSFSTSMSLAYNDEAFREKSSISHSESNIGVSLDITDNVNFSSNVGFVNPWAEDIEGGTYFTTSVSYGIK